MSFSKLNGKVEGLNDIQAEYVQKYGPGDYIPPVTLSFYSFRLMVGCGVVMLLISFVGLFFYKKDTIYGKPKLLKLMVFSIILPYIANSTGWILTEVSRTPWIVFGLLKLDKAVSPTVSAGYVLTSLIVFTLLYLVLIVIDIKLMLKFVLKTPTDNNHIKFNKNKAQEESLWI